jgi:Protein of unknown function (DUF4229)
VTRRRTAAERAPCTTAPGAPTYGVGVNDADDSAPTVAGPADAVEPAAGTVPQPEPATEEQPAAVAGAHPVLVYTALRFLVLVVVGGLLYLVGLRGVWLILFAFLVSGVLSAFVLSRPREGAAYGITSVVRRANARIDASARAEDVDDDSDEFDTPPA